MALIDVNKRSLPEQVQKNKDDIETLMVDPTTKQYVDEQDATVLQDAKDYTDDHTVDASHIDSETATNGQVLTADGNGEAAWQTPATPTITAADVDSETATSGQVLTADGNGEAAWQTPATPTITAADVDSETATSGQVLTADGNGDASWTTISAGGGGLTLLWSGSVTGAGVNVSALSDSIFNYKALVIFGYCDPYDSQRFTAMVNTPDTIKYYTVPAQALYSSGSNQGYYTFLCGLITSGTKVGCGTSIHLAQAFMGTLPALTDSAVHIEKIYGVN